MKTRRIALNEMMLTSPWLESKRDYKRIERVVMRAAGHTMTKGQEARLELLSALLLAYDAGRRNRRKSIVTVVRERPGS